LQDKQKRNGNKSRKVQTSSGELQLLWEFTQKRTLFTEKGLSPVLFTLNYFHMVSNPVISIVVPVYNSEVYLKATLDSLLFQTFKEPYEILLAIDPSKDRSLAIAESYALTHPEVIVLNQTSRLGQAASRLHAIQEAKGEYITFCDADDLMASNGLDIAVSTMRKSQCDCANFSFYVLKGNSHMFPYPFNVVHEKEVSTKKAISLYLDDRAVRGFLWTKVFKREVFASPRINLLKYSDMFEDVALSFSLLCHCKSIYLSNSRYYFYRKGNASSATSSSRHDRERCHLLVLLLMRLYLEKYGMTDLGKIYRHKLYRGHISLLFDRHIDKKNGSSKLERKALRQDYKLLKNKKSPLIKGSHYEEDVARAL
jgi:glycosyltransferase involved in cell wall biosynthesis